MEILIRVSDHIEQLHSLPGSTGTPLNLVLGLTAVPGSGRGKGVNVRGWGLCREVWEEGRAKGWVQGI